MQTKTQLSTQEGAKIAKRLLNHWKHKFEVKHDDQVIQILMPDYTITLAAQPDHLDVSIESPLEDLSHIQNVFINHLNRMAHCEFSADWQ